MWGRVGLGWGCGGAGEWVCSPCRCVSGAGASALAVLGPARAFPQERALGSAAFAGGRAAAESA